MDIAGAIHGHHRGVAAAPGEWVYVKPVAVYSVGAALHGIADGTEDGVGAERETAVATAVDAAAAARGGGNIIDAGRDYQCDRLRPAFGTRELSAAFMNAGRNDITVGIRLLFRDEHGHVNHRGSLRAEVNETSITPRSYNPQDWGTRRKKAEAKPKACPTRHPIRLHLDDGVGS